MLPDRVSNPGHLTYESGAEPSSVTSAKHLTVFGVPVFCINSKLLVLQGRSLHGSETISAIENNELYYPVLSSTGN